MKKITTFIAICTIASLCGCTKQVYYKKKEYFENDPNYLKILNEERRRYHPDPIVTEKLFPPLHLTNEQVKQLRELALQGDADAHNKLCQLFYYADDAKTNVPSTLENCLYAAQKNKPEAQAVLASLYRHGKKVKENKPLACSLDYKAANLGYPPSQERLGYCYEQGWNDLTNSISEQPDYPKAFYWYQKAAEKGDAMAQYNLGSLYYDGKGVPQDSSKALYWDQKAAEQGIITAICNVGAEYLRNNESKGLAITQIAADAGDEVAIGNFISAWINYSRFNSFNPTSSYAPSYAPHVSNTEQNDLSRKQYEGYIITEQNRRFYEENRRRMAEQNRRASQPPPPPRRR